MSLSQRTVCAALALFVSACASSPMSKPAPASAPAAGGASPTVPAPAPTAAACTSTGAYVSEFSCMPPGQLLAGTGIGVAKTEPALKGLRFPLKKGPAYLNSQVYRYQTESTYKPTNPGPDGSPMGPPNAGVAQCDSRNYSYPWQDNFCENRGGANKSCAAGTGHAGVDIRGSVCANDDPRNRVVSVASGRIVDIAPHYTKIVVPGETHYFNYMHMASRLHSAADLAAAGSGGIAVARGADLGNIGNLQRIKDGQPVLTTRHLHFEIRAPILVDGELVGPHPAPPYSALVEAYQRLLSGVDP
jgi:murein DD-endopeptidase MepM/ murein hydrolase activator NlpD